jgi:hypothetical protein
MVLMLIGIRAHLTFLVFLLILDGGTLNHVFWVLRLFGFQLRVTEVIAACINQLY